MTPKANKKQKAESTRGRIVEVATRLFLDQGFEKTTMREIAAAAGLAPGAAYYYFESKEHLVFDFYETSYAAHLPAAEELLAKEKRLSKRISGLISLHLKVSEPYYEISKVLFRIAADPQNSLSPFSPASKVLREKNIELMRRALEGEKLDVELRAKLPEMLWIFKMAGILYWLNDNSPDHEKTYALVEEGSELLTVLLSMAALPVLKGFSKKMMDLFYKFKIY
jgi:AcrR family transcriptional regulator